MARGRMINKKISNSKRINELPLGAQLLFTWLIAHLDCNGCFYGSAQMVKSLVVPRKNWRKSDVEKYLVVMEKSVDPESGCPLIQRYFVQGEGYCFMPGFEGEQIGLRKDKEKGEFPTPDGKKTESIRQNVPLSRREGEGEGEGEVEEEVEVEENNTPSLYNLSPSFDDVLACYQKNFGEPGEDMENELQLAATRFSATWVIDAMQEAHKRQKSDWRYIGRILENWRKFGKNSNNKRNDPDRYVKGRYGGSVRR